MIQPQNNRKFFFNGKVNSEVMQVKTDKIEKNVTQSANMSVHKGSTEITTDVDVQKLMTSSTQLNSSAVSDDIQTYLNQCFNPNRITRQFITYAIMSFAEEFGLESFSYGQIYNVDAAKIISAVQQEVINRNHDVTLEDAVQIVKDELHRYLPLITDIIDVISNTPGGVNLSDEEKEQKARAVSAEINAMCRAQSKGYSANNEIHQVLSDEDKLQIITEKLKTHYPELYSSTTVIPEIEPDYVSRYNESQVWSSDISISDFIEDTLLSIGIKPTQELKNKLYIEIVQAVINNNLNIGLNITSVTSIIDIMLQGAKDFPAQLVTNLMNYLLTNKDESEISGVTTCGTVKEFIINILENL